MKLNLMRSYPVFMICFQTLKNALLPIAQVTAIHLAKSCIRLLILRVVILSDVPERCFKDEIQLKAMLLSLSLKCHLHK